MSYLVEPMQFDFLNNKDRENVYRMNDHLDGSFDFKYISTNHFKHIIKDVRRQRTRKKEESSWASFVNQRKSDRSKCLDDYVIPGISNIRLLPRDSREEADQELKRLKEDALPERMSGALKSSSVNRTLGNKAKKTGKTSTMVELAEDYRSGSSIASSAVDEEMESPSTLERSPVSKLEYSVRTRKSNSERTLRANSGCGDEYKRSVKHSDYNCCSEQSGDDESDKEDEVYDVRLHPVIADKILAIQKKISALLDEIDYRLSNVPLPDGDRDLRRRQQCAMEFAIRFSRNYLYELGRQIADVKKHVKAVSPNARLKRSRRAFSLHVQAIEQKLISTHQLLLQALNAYCKHIPSSVLKGQPGKAKEILEIVVELIDICTKLHLNTDYFERGDVEPPPLGGDTHNRCAAILSKLRVSSDNESQIFNRTVQSTPVEGFRNRTNEKNDNWKGLPSRLSMYQTNTKSPGKNLRRRKQVRSCTRERKPSNTLRTTPQRFHPTTPTQQLNPSSIAHKIQQEIPKRGRAKIRSPLKEDEMSTMMSILPTDSDAGSSVAIFGDSQPSALTNKGSTTKRYSSRNPSSNHTKPPNTPTNGQPDDYENESADRSNPITEKQLSNLVPVIADLMSLVRNEQHDIQIRPVPLNSMQGLTDFLRKYRLSSEIPTDEMANNAAKMKKHENLQNCASPTTGTRSGAKNMQLICLPVEEGESKEKTKKTSRPTNQTGCNRILSVSESSLKALSTYRDEYEDWSQSNPMYTSKSQNKPWDVIAWIADKLIDELVVNVSKEFELRDVIQKLFELEFKEF